MMSNEKNLRASIAAWRKMPTTASADELRQMGNALAVAADSYMASQTPIEIDVPNFLFDEERRRRDRGNTRITSFVEHGSGIFAWPNWQAIPEQ